MVTLREEQHMNEQRSGLYDDPPPDWYQRPGMMEEKPIISEFEWGFISGASVAGGMAMLMVGWVL